MISIFPCHIFTITENFSHSRCSPVRGYRADAHAAKNAYYHR
eukprot:GSChrysophyteH1.ASY1.ANO1.62.1 assembled CDS